MTTTRSRIMRVTAGLAACAVTLSACTHAGHPAEDDSAAAHQPRTAARTTLTGAELRYGAGFRRARGVVYQPDTVIIGSGADAVRSVSSDGLVWTIDGHAPGASDLAVGKIMLATSLGTGRVLKLTKVGSDDQVVLGPASLTDVIRDANISSPGPIPISHPLFYATPGFPGAGGASSTSVPGSHFAAPVTDPPAHRFAAVTPAAGTGTMPAPTTTPTQVDAGEFQFTPIDDENGIGVSAVGHHGSGQFKAAFQLHVSKPTVTFHLDIAGGTVREASVQVHGAGGIHVHIYAIQHDSSGMMKGTVVPVPIEISVPLGGAVPLRLTIKQDLSISPNVIGKGFIDGHGDYGLQGDLAFGIGTKAPLLRVQSVVEPLSNNTAAYGLATAAVSFGWGIRAALTLGPPELNGSAYVELQFSGAVAAQTSLEIDKPSCVTDSLGLHLIWGLGYELPAIVMKAVNFFLRVVGVHEIPAKGGIDKGPITLWSPPAVEYCPNSNH